MIMESVVVAEISVPLMKVEEMLELPNETVVINKVSRRVFADIFITISSFF